MRRFLYRPLDRRWVYDDPDWIVWYRETLHDWTAVGDGPFLVTNPTGQGRGPAVIAAELLMDQHAFNNRGGKGVLPLWVPYDELAQVDARAVVDGKRAALSTITLDWLDAIDRRGRVQDAFDYVLAVLSAPSYTASNWTALEVDSLRVPLTLDADVFDAGAELGAQIRAAWSFKAPKAATLKWTGANSSEPFGVATPSEDGLAFTNGRVLEGVTEAAWTFEVSGYAVLRRWFEARATWPFTLAHAEEALQVVSSALALTQLGSDADDVLELALSSEVYSPAGGVAEDSAGSELLD